MTKSSGNTYHFSQSSPKGSGEDAPDLLRRVAASIEERKGSIVNDLILNLAKVRGEEPTISVYYSYPEGKKPPATDPKYEMKYIRATLDNKSQNDPLALLQGLNKEIKALGEVDIYNIALDNVASDQGERYMVTIYYDYKDHK